MMIKVKIPLDSDDRLTTYSLIEKLGITREEANAILWNLFDIGSVDLIPILNEEKALWGESTLSVVPTSLPEGERSMVQKGKYDLKERNKEYKLRLSKHD